MGMMNFFGWLLGRPGVARDDSVHSTLRFMELDFVQLAKRLQLESEGRRRGALDQPAPDEAGLDDIEQKIITTIDAEKKDNHEKLIDHLAGYAGRIRVLGLESLIAEVSAAGVAAAVDFKARVHTGRDQLIDLHRLVVEMNEEMETFRREHGLRRTARYPKSLLLTVGFALVMILVEAVFNGSFLAQGHELGLLGGIFWAAAIACMNVGSGLLVGHYALRNLWHRNVARKLSAGVIGLGYAVAITAFNLYVAHLRDALAGDFPEEADVLALDSLLNNTLGVTSGDSWTLFAMGLGFSLFAVIDGLAMDDVYPGYGDLDRRKGDLNDIYARQKKVLMDELEAVRTAALDRLASVGRDIQRRQGEFHSIVQASRHMRAAFVQHLDHLEHAANYLLACYRNANRQARKTPAPAHFSTAWVIERRGDTGDEIAGTGVSMDEKVARALADLPRQQQRIHRDYEAALYRYLTIEQLTPEASETNGVVGQAAR